MSNLLAKTAMALVSSSGVLLPSNHYRPVLPFPEVNYLSQLNDTQQRIQNLQKQMQQFNLQFNKLQTLPLPQLSSPAPFVAKLPALGNLQPYGPSFQFNGLKVFVEPIAQTNVMVPTTGITLDRSAGVLREQMNGSITISGVASTAVRLSHP
jgi:hypothetical protein